MTIQAVIFDNDGVLTDSEIVYSQTLSEILKDYDINESIETISLLTGGKSIDAAFKAVEDTYSVKLKSNILELWDEKANSFFSNNLKACDGTLPMLSKLKLKIAVASTSARWKLKIKHNASGLDRFFTDNMIFSGEEVANHKPAPDVYLHAAKSIKVDPVNCLAIEDSLSGVKAGVAAGMVVFGYIGASHIFDKASHNQKLLDAGAHLVFDDMSKLIDLIQEYNKKDI